MGKEVFSEDKYDTAVSIYPYRMVLLRRSGLAVVNDGREKLNG